MNSQRNSGFQKFAAIALLALLLVSPSAFADRSLEASIETTSTLVLLPSSEFGSVLVRTCQECAVKSYSLNAQSRFEAGRKQVTLQRLRELFGTSRSYNLLVTIQPGTSTVRRIVITSSLQSG